MLRLYYIYDIFPNTNSKAIARVLTIVDRPFTSQVLVEMPAMSPGRHNGKGHLWAFTTKISTAFSDEARKFFTPGITPVKGIIGTRN